MLGGQLPEVSQVPDTASLTYAFLLWVLSKFEESKLCWHGGYGCSGVFCRAVLDTEFPKRQIKY
jgi:hypothetical protein